MGKRGRGARKNEGRMTRERESERRGLEWERDAQKKKKKGGTVEESTGTLRQ